MAVSVTPFNWNSLLCVLVNWYKLIYYDGIVKWIEKWVKINFAVRIFEMDFHELGTLTEKNREDWSRVKYGSKENWRNFNEQTYTFI